MSASLLAVGASEKPWNSFEPKDQVSELASFKLRNKLMAQAQVIHIGFYSRLLLPITIKDMIENYSDEYFCERHVPCRQKASFM